MARLEQNEIEQRISAGEGWALEGDTIVKRFSCGDFVGSVELVNRVTPIAEEMNHHPDLDIRWRNVDVALATHSAGGITELDVTQAHRIVELAAQAGAEVAAPAEPGDGIEIGIDCMDPAAIRDFWRVGLGLSEKTMPDGAVDLVGNSEDSTGVWFQQMTEPRPQRNRIHIDVYVPRDHAEGRVAAVVAAGGRLVTEEHAPSWWVLADAEGNELCVCV